MRVDEVGMGAAAGARTHTQARAPRTLVGPHFAVLIVRPTYVDGVKRDDIPGACVKAFCLLLGGQREEGVA